MSEWITRFDELHNLPGHIPRHEWGVRGVNVKCECPNDFRHVLQQVDAVHLEIDPKALGNREYFDERSFCREPDLEGGAADECFGDGFRGREQVPGLPAQRERVAV